MGSLTQGTDVSTTCIRYKCKTTFQYSDKYRDLYSSVLLNYLLNISKC